MVRWGPCRHGRLCHRGRDEAICCRPQNEPYQRFGRGCTSSAPGERVGGASGFGSLKMERTRRRLPSRAGLICMNLQFILKPEKCASQRCLLRAVAITSLLRRESPGGCRFSRQDAWAALHQTQVVFDGTVPVYHMYYSNQNGVDPRSIVTTFPFHQAASTGVAAPIRRGKCCIRALAFLDFLAGAGMGDHYIGDDALDDFDTRRLRFLHLSGIEYVLVGVEAIEEKDMQGMACQRSTKFTVSMVSAFTSHARPRRRVCPEVSGWPRRDQGWRTFLAISTRGGRAGRRHRTVGRSQ